MEADFKSSSVTNSDYSLNGALKSSSCTHDIPRDILGIIAQYSRTDTVNKFVVSLVIMEYERGGYIVKSINNILTTSSLNQAIEIIYNETNCKTLCTIGEFIELNYPIIGNTIFMSRSHKWASYTEDRYYYYISIALPFGDYITYNYKDELVEIIGDKFGIHTTV